MGKTVILASSNAHKIIEFKEMLKELDIDVLGLKDIGFTEEIIENGSTFMENSYIKAKTIFDKYKLPVIADDSGLSVDALDGAPGVHSHRYANENATDEENRIKLISELKKLNLDCYTAHFYCALTYIDKEKQVQVMGELNGEISLVERGNNGFGYDPIFYLADKKMTVSELSQEEKNRISHRHNALIKLIEELKK